MRRAQRHNNLKLGFTKKLNSTSSIFSLQKTPHYSSFTETHSIHSFLFCGAWPTLCFISMQCLYPAFYSSCINNEFKTRTISKSSSYYTWLSFVPHERKSVDKFHISREYTSWASTEQGSIFTADSNPAASLRLPSIADTNTSAP